MNTCQLHSERNGAKVEEVTEYVFVLCGIWVCRVIEILICSCDTEIRANKSNMCVYYTHVSQAPSWLLPPSWKILFSFFGFCCEGAKTHT